MQAYDFEIELLDIGPPRVWRRFWLRTERTTLQNLHDLIQRTTRWRESHLAHFRDPVEWPDPRSRERGPRRPTPEDYEAAMEAESKAVLGEIFDTFGAPQLDQVPLRDVFDGTRQSCEYRYDYGDGWRVDVKLHGLVDVDKPFYAKLVDGDGTWAPDDCGGVPGFELLREIRRVVDDGGSVPEEQEEFWRWAFTIREAPFDLTREKRRFSYKRKPPPRSFWGPE